MEENKYYTPGIEEFHIGYHYEALNSKDWYFAESDYGWKKMQWEPRIGSLNQGILEIDGAIRKGWIRTAYLTKEDIEAEGFNKVGDQFESIKTYLGIGTGDDKKLCIYLDEEDYMVDIWYRSNRGDLYTKFEGVIKNKSEFRKILKMIGV